MSSHLTPIGSPQKEHMNLAVELHSRVGLLHGRRATVKSQSPFFGCQQSPFRGPPTRGRATFVVFGHYIPKASNISGK